MEIDDAAVASPYLDDELTPDREEGFLFVLSTRNNMGREVCDQPPIQGNNLLGSCRIRRLTQAITQGHKKIYERGNSYKISMDSLRSKHQRERTYARGLVSWG